MGERTWQWYHYTEICTLLECVLTKLQRALTSPPLLAYIVQLFTNSMLKKKCLRKARTAFGLQLQYLEKEREILALLKQGMLMTNISLMGMGGFIWIVKLVDNLRKLFFTSEFNYSQDIQAAILRIYSVVFLFCFVFFFHEAAVENKGKKSKLTNH